MAPFNRLVCNIKKFLLANSFIFRTNSFVKYHYKSILTDSTEIDRFLNKTPFVIYDNVKKVFRINEVNLSWPQKIAIRRLFMREVKKISTTSIKLKDLSAMHYYDHCLERYIYERLREFKKNEETCWYQDAQNNKCVGWYDPQKPFDIEGKKRFIKEKSAEKPAWGKVTNIDPLERDDDGNVFYRSSTVSEEDDTILELVDSVQENGFSNWKSLSPPIVLGYSTTTKRFNAICGRHRIAVLKYLQKQGIVSGQLDIMCHIVEYPFESLAYTRPYSIKCKQCMNNGNN